MSDFLVAGDRCNPVHRAFVPGFFYEHPRPLAPGPTFASKAPLLSVVVIAAARFGGMRHRTRADLELCARRGAAALADGHAAQVRHHAQPRPTAEPAGSAAGRSPHQGIESGLGSAGHQCPPHAAGGRGWRNKSRDAGGAGRPALTRHRAAIERRLQCVHNAESRVSPAPEAGARRIAIDRGPPGPTRSTNDGPPCCTS